MSVARQRERSEPMRYFKIILNTGRDIFVVAASKAAATELAIKNGLISKFDLYDVEDIIEVNSQEYSRGIGAKIREDV